MWQQKQRIAKLKDAIINWLCHVRRDQLVTTDTWPKYDTIRLSFMEYLWYLWCTEVQILIRMTEVRWCIEGMHCDALRAKYWLGKDRGQGVWEIFVHLCCWNSLLSSPPKSAWQLTWFYITFTVVILLMTWTLINREVVCHHHLTQVQNWKIHAWYFHPTHFLFTLLNSNRSSRPPHAPQKFGFAHCTAHSNSHWNSCRSTPTCLGRANATFLSKLSLSEARSATHYIVLTFSYLTKRFFLV